MSTVITAGNATNGLSLSADNVGAFEFKTGPGAGTTALTLSSSQVATFAGAASVPGNLSFNSGYGSAAVAYGCRAWVNFNGTGTVAIRASGNVTSITDNGTGEYTLNFTTAMSDANYSSNVSISPNYAGAYAASPAVNSSSTTESAPTTTSMRFSAVSTGGGAFDPKYANVSIFR